MWREKNTRGLRELIIGGLRAWEQSTKGKKLKCGGPEEMIFWMPFAFCRVYSEICADAFGGWNKDSDTWLHTPAE